MIGVFTKLPFSLFEDGRFGVFGVFTERSVWRFRRHDAHVAINVFALFHSSVGQEGSQ